MTEKREIIGQWWFPTNPDEKWMGTLILEPNKSPLLKVSVPKSGIELVDFKTPTVIHGTDDQGKPITLLFPCRSEISGGLKLGQMAFTAGYAVLGLELDGPADFKVNTLLLSLQHLYEWLGITGFQKAPQIPNGQIGIAHQRPKDQIFTLNSDQTLRLWSTYSKSHGKRESSIKENVFFSFESSKGLGLRDGNELIEAVRNLLHFATLDPIYMLQIKGIKKLGGNATGIAASILAKDVEVWNSIIREEVNSDHRWIFRYSDLETRFGLFFVAWLEFCKKFHEPLSCYNATVYHNLPQELQLLCLSQALEAYHDLKKQSPNDQTFLSKIRDLTQPFLQHLDGLVTNVDVFSTGVRDNRNYYTHHNPKLLNSGRVFEGAELIRLIEKLTLIFQMCILTEMNIPSDRFSILRRQLASEIIDFK